MNNTAQIIFKQNYCTGEVELKPDTFYWRLRYWLNQYVAMVCLWLIRPVIRLNAAVWRLSEGESIIDTDALSWRMGMRVQEPNNVMRIDFPHWIRKSPEKIKKAFKYFRDL